MIPLAMVMRRELPKGVPQVPFAKWDDAIQAFLLDGADEPLRMRVAVRGTGRCSDHTNANRVEQLVDRTAPLGIAIADQNSPVAERAVRLASQLPQTLDDERFVRIRRRADHPHTAGLQFDNEGGVVGHQPAGGPHFRREEVGRYQRRPVCQHERPPRRWPLPAGWNAVGVQDARDRGAPNPVAHVLQCPLDARVTLGRILRRHPNDQGPEMGLQTRTTAAAAAIRPFARHQLAVPAQNRVRRHDCRHLGEQPPPEAMSQFRQASPLVVCETQAPPRQAALQESILFVKERDQVDLLTM